MCPGFSGKQMPATSQLVIRDFLSSRSGPLEYRQVWQAMKEFTRSRDATTPDELWLLEHQPVYTLGQAGKQSHVLDAGNIPVIKIDRGGQVTYHGPGQLMCYTLLDLKRHNMSVRDLVVLLEDVVIEVLAHYGVTANGSREAPGVYVGDRKIAALGLRISRGRSYHGLCLNIDFDAGPFAGINPCGYEGMQVTQLADFTGTRNSGGNSLMQALAKQLVMVIANKLGIESSNIVYPANLEWPVSHQGVRV